MFGMSGTSGRGSLKGTVLLFLAPPTSPPLRESSCVSTVGLLGKNPVAYLPVSRAVTIKLGESPDLAELMCS